MLLTTYVRSVFTSIMAFNIIIMSVYNFIESLLKIDTVFRPFCRVPVQYIIGEWDFRTVTLAMKPPVFIPEPETEVGRCVWCIRITLCWSV